MLFFLFRLISLQHYPCWCTRVTTAFSNAEIKIATMSSKCNNCAGRLCWKVYDFNVRLFLWRMPLPHHDEGRECGCPFCVRLISNIRVNAFSFMSFCFNGLFHFLCPAEQRSSPQVPRLGLHMHATNDWMGRSGSMCLCVCVWKCWGVWQEQRWSSEAFLMSQGNQCQRRWLWWMPLRKHSVTMTSAWRNCKVSKRQSWPSAGCCREGDPLNHYLCSQVLL